LTIVFRDEEGERSLSYYKRIPRVVCKTSEEEFERDFRERFEKESEGSKLGAFPKRAWAHFPRVFCVKSC
jgi:hypothetical protein